MWRRRVAIMAPYYFIKDNEFEGTLQLAESCCGTSMI
ncbi:MAG: hypothetical protein ACC641_07530 [Acidiferrobacterales bacterium]